MYIQMEFFEGDTEDFGEVYIPNGEHWKHCFPSGDLDVYTLRNEDKNWVGEVSMFHTNGKYSAMMKCTENCQCQCGDMEEEEYKDGCPGPCEEQEVIELGIDDDDNIEGDTKCLEGKSCPFEVYWTVSGKLFFVVLTNYHCQN